MKKITQLLAALACCLLFACAPQTRGPDEVWIGTIAGPETDLMHVAAEVALKHGVTLKIIEFEDYATPNIALAEGAIDANMFQHAPYLEAVVRDRGFDLTSIGRTFIYPMGLYSKAYDNIDDIPLKSLVGLPNDPSNGARALLLYEAAGLITLRHHQLDKLTKRDILRNPKQLRFQELDAAQLPRALDDLSLAAINTNYAVVSGLNPQTQALQLEGADSPYANIVAVRANEANDAKYHILMDALQSPAVIEKARALFGENAIIAWQEKEAE